MARAARCRRWSPLASRPPARCRQPTGNQLLALRSQQLADLTATLAAFARAQSLDAANAAAAKAQAREQLRLPVAGARLRPITPRCSGTEAMDMRLFARIRAIQFVAVALTMTALNCWLLCACGSYHRARSRWRSAAFAAACLRPDGRTRAVLARLPCGLGREAAAVPRGQKAGRWTLSMPAPLRLCPPD